MAIVAQTVQIVEGRLWKALPSLAPLIRAAIVEFLGSNVDLGKAPVKEQVHKIGAGTGTLA
jgi:hypothetical protein